jgi:peptidylprolyl isomerase
MKTITILIIAAVLITAAGLTYKMTGNAINTGENSGESNQVLLKTNQGDITLQLYDDMPITVGNFKSLVEKGTYNSVIFHRIIPNFMIQGGDPTGTGFGDNSIPNIQDEFTHQGGNKNSRGTISMANAGPNTGSSQFFINLVDNNFLDGKHPTFGEVVKGMDVVDKIAKVQTNAQDRPLEEVKILEAKLI